MLSAVGRAVRPTAIARSFIRPSTLRQYAAVRLSPASAASVKASSTARKAAAKTSGSKAKPVDAKTAPKKEATKAAPKTTKTTPVKKATKVKVATVAKQSAAAAAKELERARKAAKLAKENAVKAAKKLKEKETVKAAKEKAKAAKEKERVRLLKERQKEKLAAQKARMAEMKKLRAEREQKKLENAGPRYLAAKFIEKSLVEVEPPRPAAVSAYIEYIMEKPKGQSGAFTLTEASLGWSGLSDTEKAVCKISVRDVLLTDFFRSIKQRQRPELNRGRPTTLHGSASLPANRSRKLTSPAPASGPYTSLRVFLALLGIATSRTLGTQEDLGV